MFKREIKNIGDLIRQNMRNQGLETPLLQKRLIDAWPEVVGEVIARYTREVYISNQTLMVPLMSPALRADLTMQRHMLVNRLNQHVGAQVIADIRFV